MEPQIFAALLIGKLTKFLTKKLNLGGGTAAPGLFALKIDKDLISELILKNKINSIVITGTNGKTTTSRMLSSIFVKAGISTIHNRAGSNLLRGIASSLVENSNFAGIINKEWGIWEADEAVMPEAVKQLNPKIIVVGNLFRDQLDRFGEIDKLRKLWQETLKKLHSGQIVILNNDDPQIAFLAQGLKAKVITFGIEDESFGTPDLPKTADARFCPNCQTPLNYKLTYVYHMGVYSCPKCFIKREKPKITATKIHEVNPESIHFNLTIHKETEDVKLAVGGLYNIYNALGAAATALAQGLNLKIIKAGLQEFQAAFGRVEKFEIDGKILAMYLVKNPAGFTEVIKTLFGANSKQNVLLALNDKIADGTDVSWIWDVDFDQMRNKVRKIFITGTRATDLALRLKYSGIGKFELVSNDMEKVLKAAVKNSGEKLYLLPTYTAMLELRKILNKAGVGTKFWED